MRELLESYDMLFFMAAVSCISFVMKMISSILYRRLLWDSNQMGTTDNRWMKSMMSKFEAYYKLRISVHNVENFVDRYLYHYHFLGLSLHAWEYAGEYFITAQLGFCALFCMLGGYYQMPVEWFSILGGVTIGLLLLQGMFELCFNTHLSWRIFRIQVIDYMENTMRARLENEYFHQEATRKYQMEYFEERDETTEREGTAPDTALADMPGVTFDAGTAASDTAASSELVSGGVLAGNIVMHNGDDEQEAMRQRGRLEDRSGRKGSAGAEMAELLSVFLEELQLDQEIAGKQREMTEQAAAERAELFEEILREYI